MTIIDRFGDGDRLADKLALLANELALDTETVLSTFRGLVAPWIAQREGGAAWRSEVSDDHTPIELSVALTDGDASLRLLFEPQPASSTIGAARDAGLAFLDALTAYPGVDLTRFRCVQDLFLPDRLQGRFALWISVVFARDAEPEFKVYLDPHAQGPALAPALVEEALDRLGLSHAWASLCRGALRRGPILDETKYFALDLSSRATARVKVYVHHHGATPAELVAACERACNYDAERVHAFARAMRGGDAPMSVRAPFTCHAFTTARSAQAEATVYVPVCAYAPDDAVVAERVAKYLDDEPAVDVDRYRRVLAAAATRPLDSGVGLQSWFALRCGDRGPRFTVYLATESQRVAAPGTVPAPSANPLALDSPQAVLAWLAERPIGAHPYLRGATRTSAGDAAVTQAATATTLHAALGELPKSSDPIAALGALVASVAAIRLLNLAEPAPHAFEDLQAVVALLPSHQEATHAFVRGALLAYGFLWRALDDSLCTAPVLEMPRAEPGAGRIEAAELRRSTFALSSASRVRTSLDAFGREP